MYCGKTQKQTINWIEYQIPGEVTTVYDYFLLIKCIVQTILHIIEIIELEIPKFNYFCYLKIKSRINSLILRSTYAKQQTIFELSMELSNFNFK